VAAASSILPLGYDILTFLATTVVVVPAAKRLNVSPVLAFLVSGVLLSQLG
jgi:Kef-type K+ transport system membrane component KefB